MSQTSKLRRESTGDGAASLNTITARLRVRRRSTLLRRRSSVPISGRSVAWYSRNDALIASLSTVPPSPALWSTALAISVTHTDIIVACA